MCRTSLPAHHAVVGGVERDAAVRHPPRRVATSSLRSDSETMMPVSPLLVRCCPRRGCRATRRGSRSRRRWCRTRRCRARRCRCALEPDAEIAAADDAVASRPVAVGVADEAAPAPELRRQRCCRSTTRARGAAHQQDAAAVVLERAGADLVAGGVPASNSSTAATWLCCRVQTLDHVEPRLLGQQLRLRGRTPAPCRCGR